MGKKPLGFLLGAGSSAAPIPVCDDSITSLGRDEENSIPLDDLAASRRHAYVECRNGAIFLTDLDSSNGTFVDDIRINAHEKVRLKCGQELRIGGKVFFLISADSPLETQKVVLSRAGAFSKKTTLGAGFSIKGIQEAQKERQKRIQTPPPPPTAVVPAAAVDPKKSEFSQAAPQKCALESTQKALPVMRAKAEEHTLSGAIQAGGLPQIVQMIHTRHFTGIMKVSCNKLVSTILFVNGDLYAAFSGRERGTDAIFQCALGKDASFTFDRLEVSAVETTPRNINKATMQILMECCCKIHEARKKG